MPCWSIEPYVNTVLYSAAAAHRLVAEVASPALSFVFDPAGLVTPATVASNQAITMEAFTALAGHIALVHGDDVRYEGDKAHWLPVGWGQLDAAAVFTGLIDCGYTGALIVEHLPESQVSEALAYCREHLGLQATGRAGRLPTSLSGKGGE